LRFILENRQGSRARIDGREVVIFSSNDYLGLSAHPEVLAAAGDAAKRFGTGTGGAPGTTGTTVIHERLKEKLATFKGRERAVLFPSGYQANQAIHHALDSDETVFFIDRRHHPSAIDGVRLAQKSKVARFDHLDITGLERKLAERGEAACVVSLPSVFTVDGDIAPLDKLAVLKAKHHFVLILDEAHATGCLGQTGRGIEEHFGLKGTADFLMGTFSKALGSQGGFLSFNRESEKCLHGPFRAFDFSTSLSAVSAAAALKALELLDGDPAIMESLRQAKAQIIKRCRADGINIISSASMVMLIPCKDSKELQSKLFEDGFLTIPVTARLGGESVECLRITPMATHNPQDIERFAKALGRHSELARSE
jgi:7-keto-8-aminopelargonate synthetase-like enzyme